MKLFILIIAFLSSFASLAQSGRLTGVVLDSLSHGPLASVSILIYDSSNIRGGITNGEGVFSLNDALNIDSIRFSAIGYKSIILKNLQQLQQRTLKINLVREPQNLEAVAVQPPGVLEIIHNAIERINACRHADQYENIAFYREIIKDSQQYFSVSEAVFKVQFFPVKKSSRLKLMKGRSREDVTYSRLFEDFHPGGGPQDAVNQSFVLSQPDFLNEGKTGLFIYKRELTTHFDGHRVYIISFDQRPEIREALESGRIFIDAETYSILKFEARNSPVGTPYIKSLKGTDKIFAGLLHIDYVIKGWSRIVSYREIGGLEYLDNANLKYSIDFRQPGKKLDLHLDIQSELMITDFQRRIDKEIDKEEQWKRKNLVANLPTDFDSTFWGTNDILSPTEENMKMMAAISGKNNEPDTLDSSMGWKYLNRDYFVSNGQGDSLNLVALLKCNWEDSETGGMIYKNFSADFNLETKISIRSRSNSREGPDNGFQQAGIIVRDGSGNTENSLIFSLGTGGSDKPKYFIRKTIGGKTKSQVDKTDRLDGWMRIKREGNHLFIYRKSNEKDDWLLVEKFEAEWITGTVQAGFSIMARFAGDGPKQHPDIKAAFSNIKIDP